MAIDTTDNQHRVASTKKGPVRKQRIERWVHKDRREHLSEASDGMACPMKRRLNAHVYQLGEQRQRLIEQSNFDQKLFANKQAVRHKDNQPILSTLNYVRKSCQYNEMSVDEDKQPRRTSTTAANQRNRAEKTSPKPKQKQMVKPIDETSHETASDDEIQKRHVQFEAKPQRASQSAYVLGNTRLLAEKKRMSLQIRSGTTFYRACQTDSTSSIGTNNEPRRPFSSLLSAKNSLKEFRLHPERFLSKSNRYLPLLRRQATGLAGSSISPFFDGSELTCEEAKSFLSEDIDGGRSTFSLHVPSAKKLRAPTRIDLMGSPVDDSSERLMALAYLRHRESTHLDSLIRSNPIEHILEPLSTIKERSTMSLRDLLQSIDSLRGSNGSLRNDVRRQMEIEKNRAKLAILVF